MAPILATADDPHARWRNAQPERSIGRSTGMPEVLLVDDDPDIRAMLAFTLDDYGFTIREAGDGVQALHALAEHAPDVMVLDLMMPNIDGFGVLAEMRDRNLAPTTRVLILSCKVDERDFVRGYELGA